MTCRPAPACAAALQQATRRWPDRSRATDGTCASPEHSKRNPASDHEPDHQGYATAFDLTHDPANGCDAHRLAEQLVTARDPRVKYVISRRRIWRSYDRPASRTRPFLPAWTPEPYTGSNPHVSHVHVSINGGEHRFDTRPWWALPFEEENDDVTREELDAALKPIRDQVSRIHHDHAASDSPLQRRLRTIEANVAAIKRSLEQGRG